MKEYKVQIWNHNAEEIDSCVMQLPDSVDWLHLGKVVDEHTTIEGLDSVKVSVLDRYGVMFQTTVTTYPSATVVAALVINELRTTEFGEFSIIWPVK